MKIKRPDSIIFALLATAVTAGCTNFKAANSLGTSSSTTTITTSGFDQYQITNMIVGAGNTSSSSSTPIYPLTLYINTSSSTAVDPVTTVCTVPSGNASQDPTTQCYCSFTWTEVNTTTSPATDISHAVQTPLTSIATGTLGCTMPNNYSTIATGTTIDITVIGASTNTHGFSFNTMPYITGQTSSGGDFLDSQGEYFANILRYTCYSPYQRGLTLESAIGSLTDTNGNQTATFPMGNQFCAVSAAGSTISPTSSSSGSISVSCPTMPSTSYSAQSYYFNLYISDTSTGNINSGNANYVCPTVQESLNSDGNAGSSGKYWPLDSQFALSVAQSANFTVGIVANSATSDGTNSNATCGTTTTSTAGTNTLVSSCLGWAAAPLSDGTCPSYSGTNGTTIQTYRLRRFYALYPLRFDTNGAFIQSPQSIDTIYVVDRPVTGPSGGVTALGNPVPYTMLGPKPCPYAYFDTKNVVSTPSQYEATNNTGWNDTNVDGIQFPNTDSNGSSSGATTVTASCSATLPLVNSAQTVMSATTISPYNPNSAYQKRYVRPVQSWAPHYVEDTGFLACAPLAQPLRDPPLHFSKMANGNVSYCAEVYPTQNDNVKYLDYHAAAGACTTPVSNPNQPYSGLVTPFTSHVSKNTTVAGNCAPTVPSDVSGYTYCSGTPIATHPNATTGYGVNASQTCDRTAVNPSGGITWPQFPLLAPPTDVENALAADSAYSCLVTSDAGGTGTKVRSLSPTQGCCGNPTTGISPVQVITGTGGGPSTAHLEPSSSASTPSSCQAPNY
jgi:hypothetical protein